MPIRKRTSDVMLRKREKFGRKAVAAAPCVVVNGGFETGDLTGWDTHGIITVLTNGAPEGTHYCRIEVG